jgi:hypothetical protein
MHRRDLAELLQQRLEESVGRQIAGLIEAAQ